MGCLISCLWCHLGTEMRRQMALRKAAPFLLGDSCSSPGSFALICCLLVFPVRKTHLKSVCLLEYFLNQNSQECLSGGEQGSRWGCRLFWGVATEPQWRGDGWASQVSRDQMVDFNVYVVCSPVNQKSVEDYLRWCSNKVQA